jgi:hypothetical protein
MADHPFPARAGMNRQRQPLQRVHKDTHNDAFSS